jgi:hypothetical protein
MDADVTGLRIYESAPWDTTVSQRGRMDGYSAQPTWDRRSGSSPRSGTAGWIWGVLAELEVAGLVTLADKGY